MTKRLTSTLQLVVGGHIVAFGVAAYLGNEKFYENLAMPCVRLLSAERAHNMAIWCAKHGVMPRIRDPPWPILKTQVWGKDFSSPVGIAAGFDKHGEAVDGLLKLGCGFVEVGSVTPEPQDGNPKPRVFRLPEDKAVINRYGFNSDGHETVYERLQARAEKHAGSGILGINLGKNKNSTDAVGDYVKGVGKFGELADYLVINVSSPNTPGLRNMQGRELLQTLVHAVVAERNKLPAGKRPPLLVKIAPDLTEQDMIDIAAVLGHPQSGVDGVIISNTTVSRPESLQNANKVETGGLSGAPVKHMSTEVVRTMYALLGGHVPIIGVGGVSSGQDAYDKIRAGACLVQLYSALTYHGPTLVATIKRELAGLLERDGYSSISEAVGADHKLPSRER